MQKTRKKTRKDQLQQPVIETLTRTLGTADTYEDILSRLAAERADEIKIDADDLATAIADLRADARAYPGVIWLDREGSVGRRRSGLIQEDEIELIAYDAWGLDEGTPTDWAEEIIERDDHRRELIALLKKDEVLQDEAREIFWGEVGDRYAELAKGTPAEGEDFPSDDNDTGCDGDTVEQHAAKGLKIVLERLAEEADAIKPPIPWLLINEDESLGDPCPYLYATEELAEKAKAELAQGLFEIFEQETRSGADEGGEAEALDELRQQIDIGLQVRQIGYEEARELEDTVRYAGDGTEDREAPSLTQLLDACVERYSEARDAYAEVGGDPAHFEAEEQDFWGMSRGEAKKYGRDAYAIDRDAADAAA